MSWPIHCTFRWSWSSGQSAHLQSRQSMFKSHCCLGTEKRSRARSQCSLAERNESSYWPMVRQIQLLSILKCLYCFGFSSIQQLTIWANTKLHFPWYTNELLGSIPIVPYLLRCSKQELKSVQFIHKSSTNKLSVPSNLSLSFSHLLFLHKIVFSFNLLGFFHLKFANTLLLLYLSVL